MLTFFIHYRSYSKKQRIHILGIHNSNSCHTYEGWILVKKIDESLEEGRSVLFKPITMID